MSVKYLYKVVATIEFFVHGNVVEDAEHNATFMLSDFVADNGTYIVHTCSYSSEQSDRENA